MKKLATLLFLLAAFSANAALYDYWIVVTNAPTTNHMTLVGGGSTRLFTNSVTAPATQIITNTTIGGITTNIYQHLAVTPFSGQRSAYYSGTNAIRLTFTNSVTFSVTGNWGHVTNTPGLTETALRDLRVPASGESALIRTNDWSLAVTALIDYSTNAFNQNSNLMSQAVGTTNTQTIPGIKTWTGAGIYSNTLQAFVGGVVSNVTLYSSSGRATNWAMVNPAITGASALSGTVSGGGLTNGGWTNPTFTNAIAQGAAISSPGSGNNSEEFGEDAVASGAVATAIGFSAVASGDTSFSAGAESIASGEDSVSIGASASATMPRGIAVGRDATSTHTNSAAFGYGSATTTNNQIMLGSASVNRVDTYGFIWAQGGITNILGLGTNVIRGDWSHERYDNTALANGANAAVTNGGKLYIKVSGPTAAFTINGIAGGRNGLEVEIQNSTGYAMTIAHDSGVDPVAANRILTGTGADITYTNNPTLLEFRYDSSVSRWVPKTVTATAASGVTSVTVSGTANEISSTGSPITGAGTITLSLPAELDLGGKTSLEIPNAAAPSTTVFGHIAADNNAWAASRGAVQFFDGTANTYLVGALASDAPSNGQVPTWNTGGTITWETAAYPVFNGSQFASIGGTTNIKNGATFTNIFVHDAFTMNTNVFVATNGMVGIGTNDPQARFHFYASANSSTTAEVRVENNHTGDNVQARIRILTGDTAGGVAMTAASTVHFNSNPGLFVFTENAATPIGFAQDSTIPLYINGSGNVGVGGNAPATSARLHVSGGVGESLFKISSSPDLTVSQICEHRVAADMSTSDATPASASGVAISADKTYMIEARITARRTGGTAGTAQDGASYIRRGCYKTVGGTVTLIGSVQDGFTAESQAGWDATLVVSGANVKAQVTGAVDNDIAWHVIYTVQATEN